MGKIIEAETWSKSWLRPKNRLYNLVTMTKKRAVGETLSLQSWLRPALTEVKANKDYKMFHDQIMAVDAVLGKAHLEAMAIDFAMEGFEEASIQQRCRRAEWAVKALRIQTLRMLLGNPAYRVFSRMVAGSDLLADFCRVREIDGISGISKSTVERASKFFRPDQVRWMHQVLIEMSGEEDRAAEIGLARAIETGEVLIDGTCLEGNIHYPVDWVLLRDVSRTLLKATKLVRKAGLCQRMPQSPEQFARQMNRLCIEMTNTRRKSDSRKARKAVLRRMKPLLKTIAAHAQRHRDLLEASWANTGYSQAQACQIIERMDRMLKQVPAVIKQAHERLIGERPVPSEEKILSVHQPDINVLVRGKAGREVEFGNTLVLTESTQGLILDWELYQKAAPAEWRQLQESLQRQNQFDLSTPIEAVSADRGFSTQQGSRALAEQAVYDAVCPRNPKELKERFKEEDFSRLQRRRGSTEARIAIFKQRQGRRLREGSFTHRYLAVAWGVLGHNLWMIARMLVAQQLEAKAA